MPAFLGAERLLQNVRPVLAVEFDGAGLPARDIDTQAATTWRRSAMNGRTHPAAGSSRGRGEDSGF